MADNFGLKLGIEGERAFKQSLAEINQTFKVLGSEMKLVSSQFDKNDKSVESLTARNQVLNKEIETQKDKIETLKSALANAAESFGENDKRTQAWQIQLNNAQASLNDMERELDENTKAMDDVSDASSDMGKDIDKSGESAEKSEKKFDKFKDTLSKVGKAVSAVAAAAGAAAVKLGKEVVEAFGELEQNLGGADAVFGEYADSLVKKSETAYKRMGTSQSEYLATANKMGALFQGSGVSQQRSLELTTNAMQRAADMASVMGITTESALEAVTGAAKGNYTMMDNIGVAMNATTLQAYAMSKGYDKAWASMSNAEKAEVSMSYFLEKTQQYAGNFEREATETVTGSIGLMKAAVSSFVAGLGNANADMTVLTNNIVDAFGAVVNNLTPVINNIVAALPVATDALLGAVGDLLPSLLETVTTLFDSVLTTLLEMLPELMPVAVNAVLTITDTIIDNLPLLIDSALQIVFSLIEGIAQALPDLVPEIIEIVTMIVSVIMDNLPMIIQVALELILALAQGLIQALPELIMMLPQIILAIVKAFKEFDWGTMGRNIIDGLSNGIGGSVKKAVDKIKELGRKIISAFKSLFGINSPSTVFAGFGKNLLEGLWNGIKNIQSWLISKLRGLGSAITGALKSVLGIHSPSKVFEDEIGKNLGLGIGIGFEKIMKTVKEDMAEAVPTDFDLSATVSAGAGMPSTGSSGGITLSLNIENFNNNSMQDVKELAEEISTVIAGQIKRKAAAY